jgi:hypothetical protein
MKKTLAPSLLAAASLVAASPTLVAQWTYEDQFGADVPVQDDTLGTDLVLCGDTIVAGAPGNTAAGSEAGAAYVFVRSGTTWTQQAILLGSDPTNYGHVGVTVAFDGDTVVCGSKDGASNQEGAAYVFTRSGTDWSEQTILLGTSTVSGFGVAVALDGDTALVGDHREPVRGVLAAGAVYVFRRTGTVWAQEALLTARVPVTASDFGEDIAIQGDTVVVGSTEAGPGLAHIFYRVGTVWSDATELLASDGVAGDDFGSALALDGDTLVVGAENDDIGSESAGSAYVFVRTGTDWVEQAKLTGLNGKTGDDFGATLALEGDALVVGAPRDDVQGFSSAGSAHFFVRAGTQWSLVSKLKEPAVGPNAFSAGLSLDAGRVVIGSPGNNYLGTVDAGALYVYDDEPLFTTYCTAGASANGCAASIAASGAPSVNATSGFSLTATAVEGAKSGNFIYGTGDRATLPWGNGTSLRCFASPVMRGTLQSGSGTGGFCDGTFAEDLNARWCASCPRPNHNPGPGIEMRGQLWYRDPFSTSNTTSSFSDAVEWTMGP